MDIDDLDLNMNEDREHADNGGEEDMVSHSARDSKLRRSSEVMPVSYPKENM